MGVNTIARATAAGEPAKRVQAADAGSIGADIRALRKARAMTLNEMAEHLDRSVGFASQLERGLSEPSIADLRRLAALFDVPISLFFGRPAADPRERGYVVRAGARRRLGGSEGELVEELLSPDLGGGFEIVRSEFAPGAALEEPVARDTEDAGYVVSGALDLEIGGQWFFLEPGDSFRFRGEPYRWRTRGPQAAVVIWVIAPPVY